MIALVRKSNRKIVKDVKVLAGIVVEMLKASSEIGIGLVTKLANSIVNEGVVPADWRSVLYAVWIHARM